MSSLHQYLRPTLRFRASRPCTAAASASYLRFYSIAQGLASKEDDTNVTTETSPSLNDRRTEALQRSGQDLYPRFVPDATARTWRTSSFSNRFASLVNGETPDVPQAALNGRVRSVRMSSSSLAFIDIVHDGCSVQGVCDLARISQNSISSTEFRDLFRRMRKGDIYYMKGQPHRTKRGQLSLLVTELPRLLSPCLHEMPTALRDPETRIRNRHVDFQVNDRAAQILRLRSQIITRIREYLQAKGYLEVQTPIMANLAGGAVARPFQTHAVEFSDRHIELRTAPEIWLKRLVLGGFERIFEIGPCFRNEGIDKIHNPEFTTCEFYTAYANLEYLTEVTERLISELITYTNQLSLLQLPSLSTCEISIDKPFPRIDFIEDLQGLMNAELPDLKSPDAEAGVTQMFHDNGIPLPESATLPRLLDRLASKYLEPLCQKPTWITHHPECLAPLAKSFIDRGTKQRVSARAELFIGGKEVVNTYEEENSPFEQRRKFEEQIKYRNDDNRANIDEDYLEALEWGLPPTGGWGCGIDRLVMLLSGTDRINDVLPFGNLRNVVSLGKGGRDLVVSQ
ncbi:MAG: hypothetical protein L6R42_003363 [Xanthoria sp. 1 TBL-2021]|nr:MAG: hypothetical protein L6R42_003363 [Xanthoria sp. 1 TBL-2021]